MSITSYATLQTSIGNWLNRPDLTSVIPEFIGAAEEFFKNDVRLKKLVTDDFTISSDALAVPANFDVLESWYYDGPTYFGPIEIVGADDLGTLKGRYGSSGVPRYAAIQDGKFRFAPAPDGSYSTKIAYWRSLGTVADGTSWLFDEAPYLYLFKSLEAAAPFLKDDNRVPVWAREVETRIEQIRRKTGEEQFSGTLRRHFRPIG